jgi:hypothetical protein
MKSSWCKSSPVKAVAGRPVARVAIRRVTGGCEAYTVSKQAVRIQLRNRPHCDADAVRRSEGSIRYAVMRGVAGIAGVASPGHACKGTFREPRRAPCFSANWAQVSPNPKTPGLRGVRVAPARSERPSSGVSCDQGKPEARARAGEQSYDSIVPMKVENRRAPARGGHGIHWREGMNRSMYRRSTTCTRL